MHYVLHIGTNKTGTSTLQDYLGTQRPEFQALGIWYPVIGSFPYAHHDLAYAIKKGDFGAYGISRDVISEESAPSGTTTTLISSEAFHTIRDVESVAAFFPPDKTTVVLYLREHLSYLASWYREAAQARDITCSFFDFAQIFGYSMSEMADRWEAVYGKNLHVRQYERDKLVNRDIVSDFFATAFDMAPPIIRDFQDRNPSIAGNLLFLKLVLNHFLTPQDNKDIIHELSTLATLEPRFGGKMFVSEQDARRVTHRHAQDRRDLKKRHGIAFTPIREGIEGNKSDVTTLRDDIASMIAISRERNFNFERVLLKNLDVLIPESRSS